MRQPARALGIFIAAALGASAAYAQAPAPKYPTKPVRIVVGFSPGGGTDILARLLAQKLTPVLREQVIVDNRPGANGNVGAEHVARSAPDGHTLLIMSVQYAIGKAAYRNLTYDLEKDFVGVSDVALVPQVVAVHPSLPVKSVKELVALAKAKPGQITFASSGNGSVEQMAGEMLKTAAKIDMLHVPYKGGGPAATDLAAGHVSVSFNTLPAIMHFVKDNRVRVVAVTSATRVALLPDVPTVAESGYPAYAMATWYGMVAPAGTPAGIVSLLNAELAKAIAAPDTKEKFMTVGAGPTGRMKADEFTAFIKSEVAKYAKVVRENNLKVE